MKGRLRKIVVKATCSEKIFSRLRDGASTNKLGVANISFKSKDSIVRGNNYVWESARFATETPSISYSPTITTWEYDPVDYGNGTLAL